MLNLRNLKFKLTNIIKKNIFFWIIDLRGLLKLQSNFYKKIKYNN